jgi:hypothetical protein
MALEPLLRFADLKKLGIAHSYTQINRMVASVGFPPGRGSGDERMAQSFLDPSGSERISDAARRRDARPCR